MTGQVKNPPEACEEVSQIF